MIELKPFFDEKKVTNWLNNSKNEVEKNTKIKLLSEVTFIDEKTFNKAIKYATKQFLKKFGDNQFLVVWDRDPFKSKRWVFYKIKYLLAIKKFKFLNPFKKNTTSFSYVATYFNARNLGNIIISNDIKHVVIFDDAIYSGIQILNLVSRLIDELDDLNYPIPSFNIVVGYVSNFAVKRITHELTDSSQTNFYYYDVMSTYKQIFNDDDLEKMDQMDLISLKEETPLTYFFYKVPDAASFPSSLKSLMNQPLKPYSKDTEYGKKEKIEWENSEFNSGFTQ